MGSCRSTRRWAAAGSTWRSRLSACSSAARSTGSIRTAPRRSDAGLSRRRDAGMSSRPRLCGTANAGSGGDDPVAIKPIGSAALGPARTDRFVEAVQPKHQNARSHNKRPTSLCDGQIRGPGAVRQGRGAPVRAAADQRGAERRHGPEQDVAGRGQNVVPQRPTKDAELPAAPAAGPVVVGLDGGYVRSRRRPERPFEVVAGKVIDTRGTQHRFAFARNGQATASEAFRQALAAAGVRTDTPATVLCDGDAGLWRLQREALPGATIVLDWWHAAVRFEHARQAARGLGGGTADASLVQSAVHEIVAKRMNKAQQMRWNRATVQPFLDVRIAVLNDTLEDAFRRRYPGFRPANDDHNAAAA